MDPADAELIAIDDQPLSTLEESLLEELNWAYNVLRSPETDFAVLASARELWDWHRRYERKPALRAAAEELEALYTTTALAAEFAPLSGEDRDAKQVAIIAKAELLAAADSPQEIYAFLDRAARFFGTSWRRHCLRLVALELGQHALESSAVQAFVRDSLRDDPPCERAELARLSAFRWVARLRTEQGVDILSTVEHLASLPKTEVGKADLLSALYSWAPYPRDAEPPRDDEVAYIRRQASLFVAARKIPAFVTAVAGHLDHDWSELKSLIEAVLEQAAASLPACISSLVDAVYWALRRGTSQPPMLANWLMDQVLRLTDLDLAGGHVDWELDEILKQIGCPDVTWFSRAVARRVAMERAGSLGAYGALGSGDRLSSFVASVDRFAASQEPVVTALAELVQLAASGDPAVYRLPDHLAGVDPEGLVVPSLVISEFGRTEDPERRRRLSLIAGAYGVASSAWRAMAGAILPEVNKWPTKEQRGMFHSLADPTVRMWHRARGGISDAHRGAVDQARALLAAEEDPTFRPIWQWRLEVAESRLRDEEEQASEERGE